MANKKKNGVNRRINMENEKMLGGNLNFAAAEAYKLLRTNLNFSLPDETGCKVIGVTSSLRGEGKSTTSINIAYTMAQTGSQVLLLEADLRLPTIAKRLGLRSTQGLSNLLAGQCSGTEALQKCRLIDGLWVITAGDIPPNPAELLNSEQMGIVIKAMEEYFDVIIVDLPPVTVVSDALIVSKLVDGIVVVVRENYCDRASLDTVIRQLRFAEAKILGMVMTDAASQGKKYGKRYGNGYGYEKYAQSASAKGKIDD